MTFEEWWEICTANEKLSEVELFSPNLRNLAKAAWCGGYIEGCKIIVKEVRKHDE